MADPLALQADRVHDAYERPCYKAIDTPVRLLGMHVSDWMIVVGSILAGVCLASLFASVLPLLLGPIVWTALVKIRSGKSDPGQLRYAAYRNGLVYMAALLVPDLFPTPYLFAPVWAAAPGRDIFLSAAPLPDRDRSMFMKFFLIGRRWVPRELAIARACALRSQKERA